VIDPKEEENRTEYGLESHGRTPPQVPLNSEIELGLLLELIPVLGKLDLPKIDSEVDGLLTPDNLISVTVSP
jgi:hypothetical protein